MSQFSIDNYSIKTNQCRGLYALDETMKLNQCNFDRATESESIHRREQSSKKDLPIRFSAAFSVNASKMIRSLTPFELTAITASLSKRSESKPLTANAGCNDDKFASSIPVCWSIISMRNH